MKTAIYKTYILLLALTSMLLCCCDNTKKLVQLDDSPIPLADDILRKDYPGIDVMLFASWHFSYVNADNHKTAEANQIDLHSPQRQKEILEVVKRLEAFKPTIICLEDQNQFRLDSTYQSYLADKHDLVMDEGEQLGFRVARKLGLDKLYAVDTYSWLREHYDSTLQLHGLWDEEYYLDTLQMSQWTEKYWEWYELNDTSPAKYTIDEGLRIDNHPQNLKRLIGNYLVQMKTSNDNGPDAFSLKIYNRNLRIFNNILKTNPSRDDRILVIMGATHVAFLEQIFDASPEFELYRPYAY